MWMSKPSQLRILNRKKLKSKFRVKILKSIGMNQREHEKIVWIAKIEAITALMFCLFVATGDYRESICILVPPE